MALCHYCNRGFIKERDKQQLTRTAVYELVQVLKFKIAIPDSNFLMLTNLVPLDAGGAISIGAEQADTFPKLDIDPNSNVPSSAGGGPGAGGGMGGGGGGSSSTMAGGGAGGGGSSISTPSPFYSTAASEVMRNHMTDVLEFLSDVNTLSKVKSSVKANTTPAGSGGGGSSSGGSGGSAAASGLNEDTLGGILKASLSQYLALEISKGNGRDSRTVNR